MDDFMEEVIQRIPIRDYKFDAPWQAAARRKQSDFREKEMRVPAVPNTEKSGCYGNVISADDASRGVNFYPPYWDEIRTDLKGKTGAILSNVLRSEHIPYNVFFPMRHDLAKAAILFRALTGRDVATVQDIIIEYAPSPKEKYLDDQTSFDTYIDYMNSQGERCGIGIEVKYTEQGYRIGKGELLKVNDRNSTYYRVTKDSGCFDYGGKPEEEFIIDNFGDHERGNDLRQLWRNHILGLSMMQHPEGVKEFLSVHLYPSLEEILKGLAVIFLLSGKKIRFLHEALIYGAAAGAGFSLLENLTYLYFNPQMMTGTAMVRGFGCAILHMGCTALAGTFLLFMDKVTHILPVSAIVSFVPSIIIHLVYNHAQESNLANPLLLMCIAVALFLALFTILFSYGEKRIYRWMDHSLTVDIQTLSAIRKGIFTSTKAGQYLMDVRDQLMI